MCARSAEESVLAFACATCFFDFFLFWLVVVPFVMDG